MTRHKGCTGAEDFQKMESEGIYENPREDAVLMSLRLETLSGVQEE